MAIVYKELGQSCNIKHSAELGWGVNEGTAVPRLHDIRPLFLQSFTLSQAEFLMPNAWRIKGGRPSGIHVFTYIVLYVHAQRHRKEMLLRPLHRWVN